MSDIIEFDKEYLLWIKDISTRFKQSQIKAACQVNSELMKFYWSLGRDISLLEQGNGYGAGFFKKLSIDLCKEFPEVKTFSETNLRYMKRFYELYQSVETPICVRKKQSLSNLPQLGADFEHMLFFIPWGHNKTIIDKCKGNVEKALFFVKETLENNWSRAVLLNFLDTDLYERKGKAISNFNKVLPDVQSDLAQEMTKDPYSFDFLSLREKI